MTRRHREIDHSGDAGVEAWGATRAELFEEATLGLSALMASGRVKPVVERALEASAIDEPALLVDWLGEVILSGAVHGEVYSQAKIDACDGVSVRGRVFGAPIEAGAHELRFDVKAATYHCLLFEQTDEGYHARVIFDL